MKFGVTFANGGPFAFPEELEHLACTAEAVGFESFWSIEHVVVPVGYQSRYPYDRSGKLPLGENAPITDPILPLAFLAAVTTRIRLGTGILILPQRHPLYVAKAMATLDVLSRGRAMLGVGVGWLAEEFDALGLSFEERGARTAEAVRAIRSLWQETPQPFEGKFFRWGPLESNPKPVQKPGVPIIVGGHTDLSARRAARYGDGFFPAVAKTAQLASLLAIMREECGKVGRDPAEIEVTAVCTRTTVEQMKEFEDLGVARVGIPPPALDRVRVERGLHEFAEQIMARV